MITLIVGYLNADDIADCLRALATAKLEPSFEVFIAENGGQAGMDALAQVLDSSGLSWCEDWAADSMIDAPFGCRCRKYRLIRPGGGLGARVQVAQTPENLGYAGGVNFWLRPLLNVEGWEAAWILNPDTQPAPSALEELAAYAEFRAKGMVGSCTVRTGYPDAVYTRGLAWQKLSARTMAIDRNAPIAFEPDPADIEARLWAPSGAAIYVTRKLIEAIGLMNERYFLYFEDLEWGDRARRLGAVGYAHRARVQHKLGTSLGSSPNRGSRSPLSVYLSARNSILFVRDKYPNWLIWTALMQILHICAYGAIGAIDNMTAGLKGLRAGLKGETGRPDAMLARHRLETHRASREGGDQSRF